MKTDENVIVDPCNNRKIFSNKNNHFKILRDTSTFPENTNQKKSGV